MPREDLIAVLDLETTGVDENFDSIIEVGIALIDFPAMREIDSFTSLVAPSFDAWGRMNTKDVVREMHKANGLYAEIERVHKDIDLSSALHPEVVDKAINKWLKPYGQTHIPLAGSGVGHFDRRFIKRYLPRLDKRLTHFVLDVGVTRRLWTMAGATPASDEGKTHRALDDARVHADEFRFYINSIKRLRDLEVVPAGAVVVDDAFAGIDVTIAEISPDNLISNG